MSRKETDLYNKEFALDKQRDDLEANERNLVSREQHLTDQLQRLSIDQSTLAEKEKEFHAKQANLNCILDNLEEHKKQQEELVSQPNQAIHQNQSRYSTL